MQYVGSKHRLAKYLLPSVLINREGKTYVEPFVGGANLICKVEGNRIGNDNNPYLISLLRALQEGWIPPTTITEEKYYAVKSNLHYLKAYNLRVEITEI